MGKKELIRQKVITVLVPERSWKMSFSVYILWSEEEMKLCRGRKNPAI